MVYVSCSFNAVGELYDALEMPPHKFEALYGVKMPSEEDEILFVCRMGIRSFTAIQIALESGFSR